jgi:tetratricopeptide (TPR) repeat protein
MASTRLNLVQHLLDHARYLQQLGRTHDALRLLTQLSRFRDLPADAAEEAQFRLGQLWLRRKKPRRARRHLAAALTHNPNNARYHYFLARAYDTHRDGDPDRAAEHYRTSLQLDAAQTDCLCDWASLALDLGRTDEAVDALRTAAGQAPDDLKLLGKVLTGLRRAGRADEARRLIVAARFRHPRDGRYTALWNRFQFDATRLGQEQARRGRRRPANEPVLLPFVRPEPAPVKPAVAGRVLRHDGPSSPTPHLPHPSRLGDQRHAL